MKQEKNQSRLVSLMAVAIAVVSFIGCIPPEHIEEVLSGEIELVAATLFTLDDSAFEVHIENAAGHHVMTMEMVHLEVREVGSETWREIELTAMGEHYAGTRTFNSSGEYELRLMGAEHSEHEMEEMDSIFVTVNRAHADVAQYHVQYESDPGHIHEGDTVALSTWIAIEETGDPVTGLAVQFVVEESDEVVTVLDAVEGDAGVYSAEMMFGIDGDVHMDIQFTDDTGAAFAADFHVHVSAVH